MHPDRGIVRMDRRTESLSTITDDPNTLNRQSAITNNSPGTPLFSPITWNPAQTRTGSTLRLRLLSHNHCQCHDRCDHSTAAPRSRPLKRHVSDTSTVIGIGSFALATVYDLI